MNPYSSIFVFGREYGYRYSPARKVDSPMGRFGGGWQFKLGIQWGGDWRNGIVSWGTNEMRYRFGVHNG